MKLKIFLFGFATAIASMLLLQSCLTRVKPGDKSFAFTKKLITYDQCKELFNNYSAKNYAYINEKRSGNSPDSRSYWYSVEELEGYINYIKTQGKRNGFKNLGIRIYMGQYHDTKLIDDRQKPEYKGLQTIFMVPTSGDEQSKNGTNADPQEGNTDITTMFGFDLSTLTPPPRASSDKMVNTDQ